MKALLVFLAACGAAEPVPAAKPAPAPVCSLTHGTTVYAEDGATPRCDVLDRVVNLGLQELADAGLDASKFAADLEIDITASNDPPCGGSIACTTSATHMILSSWVPPAGTYYDYHSTCYESLFGHEMVHWALWANGLDPDQHHLNPKWFIERTSLATVAQDAMIDGVCP